MRQSLYVEKDAYMSKSGLSPRILEVIAGGFFGVLEGSPR